MRARSPFVVVACFLGHFLLQLPDPTRFGLFLVAFCLSVFCLCVRRARLPSCLATGQAVVHVKGILRCALVTETSETFQTAEIDQLGLLANLQALISLSTDISELNVYLKKYKHISVGPMYVVHIVSQEKSFRFESKLARKHRSARAHPFVGVLSRGRLLCSPPTAGSLARMP